MDWSERYRKFGYDAGAIVDLFLDAHARPPARITLDSVASMASNKNLFSNFLHIPFP